MKYSIIAVRTGSHILVESMLRSVKKNLTPDEIIIVDHKFRYSNRGGRHGEGINKAVNQARNNLILILDHDVIIVNNELEKVMLKTMEDPEVFCCGAYEWYDEGRHTILPPCMMIKKDLYLKNTARYNNTGNPAANMCAEARDVHGLKLIKLDLDPYIFHLSYGCRLFYDSLMPKWKKQFEQWKTRHKVNVEFTDYVVDDGMSISDHDWLSWTIMDHLRWAMHKKQPWSMMRLGDLGLRAMIDFYWNRKSFDHLIVEHPDLAMPTPEIGVQLTEELIKNMKEADWIDHPKLYKGAFHALYNWRGVLTKADKVYDEAGFTHHTRPRQKGAHRMLCCSLAGYLAFAKEFELTLYDIIKNKKVMYIGPYPELKNLNQRKNLHLVNTAYHQLSMSSNHWERYEVMNSFFDKYNVNDWDLILVTGSLYGRTLIGRIKQEGGRAFDIGQGIFFNPNNIFEVAVKKVDNSTYYEIIDSSEKQEVDVWEDVTVLSKGQ